MRENSQVRATKKNQPREQLYLMEFKTTFQWVATGGSGWLRLPRGARLKNEFEPQLHEVTFDMARQINRNAPLENVKKRKAHAGVNTNCARAGPELLMAN